jgi:hypothetical protein
VSEADLEAKNAKYMDPVIFAKLCSEHTVVSF